MRFTLEMPDFTKRIIVTGTAFSDAEHRQAFSAAFRAEDNTVIGFVEKKSAEKRKNGDVKEKRRMSPYQYKSDPKPQLGEWHTILEEPKKAGPYIVTLMPRDRTLYDRQVREAIYNGEEWELPANKRLVAWRLMPDAYEGGYVMDDDGVHLLVEAIIYQIQEDYISSAKKIAECNEKIKELNAKQRNDYYKNVKARMSETIKIERSKMADCENAILYGWPGLVGGDVYAQEALARMKRAAKEYADE